MSDSSSIKASPDSASPVAVQNPSKATLDSGTRWASWMAATPCKPSSSLLLSPKSYLMQRTVLIGALLDAFKENGLWTLRALNDKLNQPEQYLLWNLETLADLSEGGEHDGTYKLKPEVSDWMYYENCYEDYYDYGLSTG